ncbi:MAG: hypothetical protein ACREIC_24320, partial [Limisphaerales bacterium]
MLQTIANQGVFATLPPGLTQYGNPSRRWSVKALPPGVRRECPPTALTAGAVVTVRRCSLIVLAVLSFLGAAVESAQCSLVLTNAAQVQALSPSQAKTEPSVQIRGMVTCYDPERVLFIQDPTAGVFVYYNGERLSLQFGQFVQVTGRVIPGRYSAIISPQKIQSLDKGPEVNPQPVSLGAIYLGGLDAQWVEVQGVCRTQRLLDGRLRLELADSPFRISVWVHDYRGYEPLAMLGSLLRVRGVVGIGVNAQNQMEGFQLFANSVSDVTIVKPGPTNPFSMPCHLVKDLNASFVRRAATGLVHASGAVTLRGPGPVLYIQDLTGGLEVHGQGAWEDLAPGDDVDVVGYMGPITQAPRLEDAIVQKRKTNELLRP